MEGVAKVDEDATLLALDREPPVERPDAFLIYIRAIASRWEDEAGRRKQERSKRREQEIMRAAIRVFARDGISRARIGDIASEAGMPVSSLYEYFGRKELLAYAVPTEHLTRFYLEYAAAVADKTTYRERLRLYLWLAGDFRSPQSRLGAAALFGDLAKRAREPNGTSAHHRRLRPRDRAFDQGRRTQWRVGRQRPL